MSRFANSLALSHLVCPLVSYAMAGTVVNPVERRMDRLGLFLSVQSSSWMLRPLESK